MDIDKNTWWIIGGLVALIVIALLWLIVSRPASSASSVKTDTTPSNSQFPAYTSPSGTESGAVMQAVASGETISVDDQASGMSVAINSVKLTKPSWVAIRDTKGWILGAAWFAESAEATSVSLLRETVAGQTYQAVIYVDDGDKKFHLHADSIVLASESAPVSATFNAQ